MSTDLKATMYPDDRIVTTYRHKAWEVFGCGHYRGEIDKSGKKFRWRVWSVVGPVPVGSGRVDTRKSAKERAFRVLAKAAGIPTEIPG